ncbi:hypothetical protein EXS65_03255 [Candidatus Peribacteria bacterium]|nr:hypothetical protein [Candidatus Peribacteria bacterium]
MHFLRKTFAPLSDRQALCREVPKEHLQHPLPERNASESVQRMLMQKATQNDVAAVMTPDSTEELLSAA